MAFGITLRSPFRILSTQEYMACTISNAHTAGEKGRHVVCLLMERIQDDYIGDAKRLEPSEPAPAPTSRWSRWCKTPIRTTFS